MIAIISGCGSGIGRELMNRLCKDNDVIGFSKNVKPMEDWRVHVFEGDSADSRTWVKVVKIAKKIYKKEARMIEIAGTFGRTMREHTESRSFILHPSTFDYPPMATADGTDFKSQKEAEEYKRLAREILDISKEVARRAKILSEESREIADRMKKNAEK